MGQIIDQNPDEEAEDNWALVTGTTVSNVIVAAFSFIESIQDDYDYLVDITYGENAANCGPNSTYDPVANTFSAPPVDWEQVLEDDFSLLQSALLQCLSDASYASSEQVSGAISEATTAASATFSANESDLWDAICTWISNGG